MWIYAIADSGLLVDQKTTLKNILIYLLFLSASLHAQVDTHLVAITKHTIESKILGTERNYYVSLPTHYDSTKTYPIMYVLDAEWRYGITNAIEKELASNYKIPAHIVVGITHPNRKLDMSFSSTQVQFDGKPKLDSTYFNSENSGNGLKFLNFLEDELIVEINRRYSTNGFNILIGHSLGGYFCSYILPIQKSFQSLQIYDPSLWYSEGEAIRQIDHNLFQNTHCTIFLSSSSNRSHEYNYHHKTIRKLKKTLNHFPNIQMKYKYYKHEHHNSMYMHSFLDGMALLYADYEKKFKTTIP